jgi:Carboxypeptidase regulatory-like domain
MLIRSALRRFVVSGAILFAGGLALHAAEVQVNVKGMDGKNLAGAEVRIEGGGSGAKQSGKTDQKGRYIFKDLAQGTYKVSVFVNQAPSSLDNVQVRPTVPMRVEFNLKAIAAGKKPRLWAYGKEQGGSYGGRWFELGASGRLPLGFEPLAQDTGKSQESQE